MSLIQPGSGRAPRFVVLLVSILVELMVAPLLARSEQGLHVAQATAILVMAAALWAAEANLVAVLFFAVVVAIQFFALYSGSAVIEVVALLGRLLLFSYATGLIMWRTLRSSEVTTDTIAGAAGAYTLLALVWATLYILLEFVHPGSFQIPAVWRMGPANDPNAALVYFSFVTLTTVGYGDITPVWPGAGGLAAAEAVVGQLYLAITIARLVGLHTSHRG